MFQVFQLTALVIRGFATCGKNFIVKLGRFAIKEEEVPGLLLCVQVFVRTPHFTQRGFFSESGLTMLSESVAIADSITSSPVQAPWNFVETACTGEVKSDLRACWDREFCAVSLPKTPVSDGVMVAPLRARQHQRQGC